MLEIVITSSFKNDFKRESKDPKNKDLAIRLERFLCLLTNELPIPRSYKQHRLMGKYKSYLESHLRPDLLIIYKVEEGKFLYLIRLGSHSNLFK